jgi:hypothetical protein
MSARREAIVSYIGAVLGLVVALSAAIREQFGPAAVVAVGALFLAYWGHRAEGNRGER